MKTLKTYLIIFSLVFNGFVYTQQCDLIVPTGDFTPKIISRGDLITITATIQNIGLANSSPSHLGFYISTSSEISKGVMIDCVSVEPLAAGASSEKKQIVIPIPSSFTSGNYYIGWKVDPYKEVLESNENNVFYLPNTQLTVTNNLVFGRHIPYPIVFIHGLNSNDQTWSTLLSWLDLYGWSFGGRMDFCLNYDGDFSSSILSNDIHDFTLLSNLKVGDYYTVNFDVNSNGTIYNNTIESNQAAIVKQGKALQLAIRHVLDKTGSDKVILVGHSMGGLASREYLQNSSDWQLDGKHHVAKLFTVGTPHGGSNQSTFGGFLTGIDGYSDAVRDLRWEYSNGRAGVYLFGGNENNLSPIGFNNLDVNCNGFVGDNILGLNQKNLPSNLSYSCVIGVGGLSGDGLVDATRANLNNYYKANADTFIVDAFHWNLPKEIKTLISGIDEPINHEQAYHLGMDTLYYGLITSQSKSNTFTDDYDTYAINIGKDSRLNIKVSNIPVPQLSFALFDESHSMKFANYCKNLNQIDTTAFLLQGKYYLVIQATPDSYSWNYPYTIKLHATPTTDVFDNIAKIPDEFLLDQNFPNPFNSSTSISFHLPTRTFVTLKVFDILGREVSSLISEELRAGEHTIHWDAFRFPSGTYFYQLQSENHVETKKLILLK